MKTWMLGHISPSRLCIIREWIYLKAWKNCADVNNIEKKKQYSMKLNWEIVNAPLKWLYMNINMILTIPVVHISHIIHIKMRQHILSLQWRIVLCYFFIVKLFIFVHFILYKMDTNDAVFPDVAFFLFCNLSITSENKKMPKHYKNVFLDECIYFIKAKAKM